MEPLIPPTATKYFGPQNYFVMNDPRTQIIYDDARHFVLTTHEKFDIITSDPIHPWVKGSATLYSKEYFELVKQHLNPGGVITQWVPLYESDPETVSHGARHPGDRAQLLDRPRAHARRDPLPRRALPHPRPLHPERRPAAAGPGRRDDLPREARAAGRRRSASSSSATA